MEETRQQPYIPELLAVPRASWWLSVVLLAVLIVGVVSVLVSTAAEGVPRKPGPGFVDAVFANTLTLAAVRVAVLAAAGYIVASVAALVHARRWLIRVGPVEVSATASQLQQEIAGLQLARLEAENAMLHARADEMETNVRRVAAEFREQVESSANIRDDEGQRHE